MFTAGRSGAGTGSAQWMIAQKSALLTSVASMSKGFCVTECLSAPARNVPPGIEIMLETILPATPRGEGAMGTSAALRIITHATADIPVTSSTAAYTTSDN